MDGRNTATYAVFFCLLLAGFAGVAGLYPLDQAGESREFRFEEVSEAQQFKYTATSGAVLTRAGGTYVSDVNNDGLPDMLLTGGRTRLPPDFDDFGRVDPAEPVLVINRNGSIDYRPVSIPARVEDERVTGALFFDYDNDGWDDLLLMPLESRPVLLENHDGVLVPADENFTTVITEPRGATTADYNRDGCLDLFVYQEGNWKLRLPHGHSDTTPNSTGDNGNPNYLFKGDCNGGFERVNESGISGTRWSLAATSVDLNDDGWPDIHVANDFNHDFVYINQHDGSFREMKLSEATDRNAMSSEIADVNRDGLPDIFVTNIYFNRSNIQNEGFEESLDSRLGTRMEGNNLLINEDNGTFRDEATEYGVRKGGWGWAAILADFNNDGRLDLFHTASKLSPRAAAGLTAPYVSYPVFFEGTADGFTDRHPANIGFNESDGMGAAVLDLDRDGALDIVLGTDAHERFKLYENNADGGDWLQVDVRPTDDRPAIGTEVQVTVDGETRTRTYHAQTDYLSQDSRVLHFGLDDHETVDSIRIVYPDGTECEFTDVETNRRIAVSGCSIDVDRAP